MKRSFVMRVGDVMRFFRISYRQAQYWEKTNLIRATEQVGLRSKGYPFIEVVLLKVLCLLRNKASIQHMRTLISKLRNKLGALSYPIEESVILLENNRFFIAKKDIIDSEDSLLKLDCKKLNEDLLEFLEN